MDKAPSRRERLRAETLGEIRHLAMAQVAESGPEALSLNAIAREMGMSGPAIYRYFASRDALMSALVVDAFEDLTSRLAAELAGASRRSPENRFRALADAYRGWALAHPRAYPLLLAGGLAGSDQPEEIALASQRAMDLILAALGDVAADSGTGAEDPPSQLAAQLRRWASARGSDEQLPASILLLGITTWQRLHGHVSLELEGLHAAMGVGSEALFRSEIDSILSELGGDSSRS